MTTVSEGIAAALAGLGVRTVWGVVGDALTPFTDAVRRRDDIAWVGVRHEEAGAFAAGAQSQLGAPLGVAAGTVGPGSVHLVNGLYDAAKSRTPLLALCGQVPLAELGGDYFQEVDNDALFADVAVLARTVTHPAQLPRLLEQAIRAAIAERGVAVLTLPGDVAGADLEAELPPLRVPAGPPAVPAPPDALLDDAAALLRDAGAVTILAGIGAAGARDDVLALAEVLAAPVVVTFRGKEGFEGGNAFAVGQTGLLGNPAAAQAVRDADALLMLGTDFPYRDFYPDGATVVQVDARGEVIGRRTRVDLGLTGDAGAAARGLTARLGGGEPRDRGHLDGAIDRYRDWRAGQARLADPAHDDGLAGRLRSRLDNAERRIRPEVLAAALDRTAADDAIFTVDTGMTAVWVARLVDMHGGRRLLGSFNYGSMANALPQAMGAAASFPDRQVIACCGDGGLTMLLGELLTVAARRLPVTIVVFDNEQLGMVKVEQEEVGDPEFGTSLATGADLAALARAAGLHAIRVTEAGDVEAAVAEALATPGPVLLDVLTNPSEVALPPVVGPSQAVGFAVAKVREAVRGTRG